MTARAVACILAVAFLAAGCLQVDVGDITGWGGGGSKTPKDEGVAVYDGSFDDVWDAACSVAQDLVKVSEKKRWIDDSEGRGKLKGRTKDDVQVEFQLKEKGAGVEVKVKVTGSSDMASSIHARIRSKL